MDIEKKHLADWGEYAAGIAEKSEYDLSEKEIARVYREYPQKKKRE